MCLSCTRLGRAKGSVTLPESHANLYSDFFLNQLVAAGLVSNKNAQSALIASAFQLVCVCLGLQVYNFLGFHP